MKKKKYEVWFTYGDDLVGNDYLVRSAKDARKQHRAKGYPDTIVRINVKQKKKKSKRFNDYLKAQKYGERRYGYGKFIIRRVKGTGTEYDSKEAEFVVLRKTRMPAKFAHTSVHFRPRH